MKAPTVRTGRTSDRDQAPVSIRILYPSHPSTRATESTEKVDRWTTTPAVCEVSPGSTCVGPRLLPFALVALIATLNSGCTLAIRGIAGAGVRGAALGGAARVGAAAIGVRGAATIGAASRLGLAASEVAAFRGAATTGLLGPRSLAGLGRAQVVGRGGSVLGVVEPAGVDGLVVRTPRGMAVRAFREGPRVSYRVGGQSVGYSELQDGRVHHYIYESGSARPIGYDVVQNGRVLQYDANGLFVAETSLQRAGAGSGGAVGIAATATVLAASLEKDRTAERRARVLLSRIDALLAARRTQ